MVVCRVEVISKHAKLALVWMENRQCVLIYRVSISKDFPKKKTPFSLDSWHYPELNL